MGEILITFIKQSTAYKLTRAASKSNIAVRLVQAPKELSAGGCSYGVLAKRSELSRLVSLCRQYGIEYRRILAVYTDVSGKKTYSQI
ncbi:MAG: DUF3343 domain-containing protein [Clostridia bacterium]|nr:DUF3343 domain-containing protein [Clostridia bacterium]